MSTTDITKLRAETGAGVLDCKKAIDEADGDYDTAIELLRKRGVVQAVKRSGKIAAEGLVASYIHGIGKIGVLVEINSETDFVAKNELFQSLVNDIAMHIAAAAPKYLIRDDVPEVLVIQEKDIYREQMKNKGKTTEVIDKIILGKLDKFFRDVCLMEQPFIKNEDITIEQLLATKTGEIGEKISIRRFVRYELGEGIKKESTNFVAEVEAELNK